MEPTELRRARSGLRRYRRPGGFLLAAAAMVAVAGACGSGPSTRSSAASSGTPGGSVEASLPVPTGLTPSSAPTSVVLPATPPAPPAPASTAPVTTGVAAAAVAPFSASSSTVTAADLPYTWRPGCPVGPDQLRRISLSYWGFDGRSHTGQIVVNVSVVPAVEGVFRTLYDDRFPIQEMIPQDAYHGDDNAAAAADDTSGFNCRDAVTAGPPQWSVHAYGEAIDVNDVQNPYIDGSTVIPPAGAAYTDRSDIRPGMAVPGGRLVEAFATAGWQWGGRWTDTPDYQHFSATGG